MYMCLLAYVQEDGVSVEPRFFIPIVPALLLNGSRGIGEQPCIIPCNVM